LFVAPTTSPVHPEGFLLGIVAASTLTLARTMNRTVMTNTRKDLEANMFLRSLRSEDCENGELIPFYVDKKGQ